MKININKTINELLESNINTNQLAKETGINYSIIYRLRSGERNINNLKVDTAEKLYNYKVSVDEILKLKERMNFRFDVLKSDDVNKSITYYLGNQYVATLLWTSYTTCSVSVYYRDNGKQSTEYDTEEQDVDFIYEMLVQQSKL
ncbi:hypothetical protein BU002_02195 [Mammaliicoccus sciuri]|uniref:helix-turn-helix domain-containing protein n=1 Tax=Mammaliicoccus sciuri TaxID=1296 RepID=UPI000E68E552|nr:hypothetical protein [Mammaliicoccus sciuri]RIN97151.1 hypothetical protein BU002_02195 [Mammaliicoccus sciuri]